MQPEPHIALAADFTGPITDPGGGSYEQFVSPDPPDHDPFTDYPSALVAPVRSVKLPMTVTASLAHNLAVRRQRIWACWGTGVVVGWIGDTSHQAECSDHNKDAIGQVHAIDPMVTGARAQLVVTQSLAHPGDLQYIIHNRVIWSRTVGFAARKYTGADPHTNHVHLSGKHGGSHRSSATCTGYDLDAQATTPTFELCPAVVGGDDVTDAQLKQAIADGITQWWADAYAAANGQASGDTTDDRRKRNYRDFVRKVTGGPVDQGAILGAIAAADNNVSAQQLADALRPGLAADIVAGLPDDGNGLTQDQVEQAIRNVLGGLG
jgi:hypothetical protein